MKVPARRLEVVGDFSPIFVRELDKETANVLFTSTAFVSKIRRLYRQRGEVNRKRRKDGKESCLVSLCLFFVFRFCALVLHTKRQV